MCQYCPKYAILISISVILLNINTITATDTRTRSFLEDGTVLVIGPESTSEINHNDNQLLLLPANVDTKLRKLGLSVQEIKDFGVSQLPEDLRKRASEVIDTSMNTVNNLAGIPQRMAYPVGTDIPEIKISDKIDLGEVQPELITLFEEIFPNINVEITKPEAFLTDHASEVERLRREYFMQDQHWNYDLLNGKDISTPDLHSLHVSIRSSQNLIGSLRIPISVIPYLSELPDIVERVRNLMYTASAASLTKSPIDGQGALDNLHKLASDNPQLAKEITHAIRNGIFPTVERLCVLPFSNFKDMILANGYLEKYRRIFDDPNGNGQMHIRFLYYLYAAKINSLLMASMCGICVGIGAKKILIQTNPKFKSILIKNFGAKSIIDISSIRQKTLNGDIEEEDTCETYIFDLAAAMTYMTEPQNEVMKLIYAQRIADILVSQMAKDPEIKSDPTSLLVLANMRNTLENSAKVDSPELAKEHREINRRQKLMSFMYDIKYALIDRIDRRRYYGHKVFEQ